MLNRDRWSEILQVLTTNWFRTVLTAFGVFWGIFILILLLSAGKGLENGIRSDFGDIATNSIFTWTQKATKAYKGLPKDRIYYYDTDDVPALWNNVDGLRYVSPRNQSGGTNVVRGLKTGAYTIYGDYPQIIKQDPMDITSGRFINQSDIEQKRKVAVIGVDVRNSLFEKGEIVLGTYIKINNVNFMVIGTYKKSNNDWAEAQKEIYMPFTTFNQVFNRGNNIGWMAITAVDGTPITAIKEQIFTLLKERHRIHPADARAIGHFDLFEQFSRVQRLFGALQFIGYFVGILVLLSGVIGVSNIMLIVVKERTKEIGIRRALGESPWSIKKQILMESIFLTIISGMAGIVVGALTIFGVNYILDANGPVAMFVNPSVNLGVVSIALIILIITGLLAGFIPANSAIKVRPIEALRTE